MKRLTDRKVYETEKQTYFGWDLRKSEWERIWWKRSPRLSPDELKNWPYQFDPEKKGQDMGPDFCIVVQGNPEDSLLDLWLRQEEHGMEMTCVA